MLNPVAVGTGVKEGVFDRVGVWVVFAQDIFDIEDIVILVNKGGIAVSGESDTGSKGERLC